MLESPFELPKKICLIKQTLLCQINANLSHTCTSFIDGIFQKESYSGDSYDQNNNNKKKKKKNSKWITTSAEKGKKIHYSTKTYA